MNTLEALKSYFGYDSFKEGQEAVIQSILEGRDILAVMPTGSGKSICYQLPAVLMPGITIVVSPLISLMHDQVKSLNDSGIRSGFINSSLSETQISRVYNRALNGEFKILYAAPERLETGSFLYFADHTDISMISVDEAHCISQWGQDFRPSYLKIVRFIEHLKKRPVISAFTATATEEVKTDIISILKLQNPLVTVTGFDRGNLYFEVESTKKKDDFILSYIQSHPNDSGIIYCATRKNTDSVFELLQSNGIAAARYHAGMSKEERTSSQDDFIYDRSRVIAATNAFGMGIDKSNVRFVIHYNMPQSMENYYQEAGRAGRDGEPAKCILLFSDQDVIINKFLLEHKENAELNPDETELIHQRDLKRLRVMERYCSTSSCLRNYILRYFGEQRQQPCGSCGNCRKSFTEADMTAEAKTIINCVFETKGRYGINVILDTLLGSGRERLKELGTIQYRTYGALSNYSKADLRSLIDQLISDGYLYQSEDQFRVIGLGNIDPLKEEGTRVFVKRYEQQEDDYPVSDSKTMYGNRDSLTNAGVQLFDLLRQLRASLAQKEGFPPYIVCSDRTLTDMCIKLPRTRIEMLTVSGIGQTKYQKYGEPFIQEITKFLNENPGVISWVKEGAAPSQSQGRTYRKRIPTLSRKSAFYLTAQDAEQFVYQEYCYASYINNELNRITSAQHVKRLQFKHIWAFLTSLGYVNETVTDQGETERIPTEAGIEKGIIVIDKPDRTGVTHPYLMYPESVQKEVVEHYTVPD